MNKPKKARKINVDYASIISKVCNNLSIKLIHISTDHLFDGKVSFMLRMIKLVL